MGRIELKFQNFSIFFLIPLILSIGLASSISFFDLIQEAEGVPAEGTSSEKSYGSKTAGIVCGDRLCSEVEQVGETSSSSLPEVTEEEVSNDSQRFLEIKGDPVTNGTVTYQVVVSGQISLGPRANPNDIISPDGTTIDGKILPTGIDNYYFTGNIVSITADQHVFSFVDEVEVPTQVIPEFGTIAIMILGFAIISIITVTARSKVIPRLWNLWVLTLWIR